VARLDLLSGTLIFGDRLVSIEDNNKIMLTLDGHLVLGAALNPIPYGFLLAEDTSNITWENTDNILLEGSRR
jgi:hypothetical protein